MFRGLVKNPRLGALIISSVFVGLVGAFPLTAKDNKKQEAEALLTKARELTDIRCEGCPSFKLRARFRWWEPSGREVRGLYIMDWISSGQWRDDVSSSLYRQTRVRKGDRLWRHRDFSKPSIRLLRFLKGIDMREALELYAGGEVGKFKDRNDGASRVRCFEDSALGKGTNTLCFETASSQLVQTGNDAWLTSYLDYLPFGSKTFPRRIRTTTDNNPEMEIEVEQLVQAESQETISLEIPVGSLEFPTCDAPVPARLLNRPPPTYPAIAKHKRISGVVQIIGEVDTQGKFQKGVVEESPDPLLSESSLKAISNWTYEAAHCGGTKIPEEQSIQINYMLK